MKPTSNNGGGSGDVRTNTGAGTGATTPNNTNMPPFYLFDAPVELRANFMANARRIGLPIQHDPNSYHYGETVNGFHPQQLLNQQQQQAGGQTLASMAAAAAATTPSAFVRGPAVAAAAATATAAATAADPANTTSSNVSSHQHRQHRHTMPPQLIDGRHGGVVPRHTPVGYNNMMGGGARMNSIVGGGNANTTAKPRVKNVREQKRAQKITELIEQLRLQMEDGGWKVELRSKFHTLSS